MRKTLAYGRKPFRKVFRKGDRVVTHGNTTRRGVVDGFYRTAEGRDLLVIVARQTDQHPKAQWLHRSDHVQPLSPRQRLPGAKDDLTL